MFSSRVTRDRTQNRVAAAVAAHQTSGRPLLDLTTTNPTTCGIEYPSDILAPLNDARALTYAPDPFGLKSAREAVARDFARRGTGVATPEAEDALFTADPDRIILTASTSEAYALLFKLLCEPAGDNVLVPEPSYPLFEHLTRLDGVTPRAYALEYHGRWELDQRSVDGAWTARTRAVLAVTPNNPTGSALTSHELMALASRCAAREAALIVDEVFADYPLTDAGRPGAWGSTPALAFRLGGLSKSAGLPQVKLGWIAVDGPAALVEEALGRLELICDTYLSVSTPVQVAAPMLIARGAVVREQIHHRIRTNLRVLHSIAADHPAADVLTPDAGWSAVLRVPAMSSEDELVVSLLERRGTLVHPGFFFDFPHEAFVVISLLPAPEIFREGVTRLMEHLDA